MTGIQDTLTKASVALSASKISYALIGGFALAAHGVVRATVDIDMLVDGHKKDQAKKVLEDAGFQTVHESNEVLQLSGLGQLDLLFANRQPTQKMLQRAQTIQDFPAPVVSAEDIIGLKIQAYKNDLKREFQDKADIQALLEKNKGLDFKLIKTYADLFNEWDFIQELRSRI